MMYGVPRMRVSSYPIRERSLRSESRSAPVAGMICDDGGESIHRHHCNLMLRIEREAAPVSAADVRRDDQRPSSDGGVKMPSLRFPRISSWHAAFDVCASHECGLSGGSDENG
jgi:hypothetical protein